MTSEQKRTYWQHHIERWQVSELSQKAYCIENNLSYASFGYWRTRLKRNAVPEKKLIPVTLSRPADSVTIILPVGVRMEVPVHALADVLAVVCQIKPGLS